MNKDTHLNKQQLLYCGISFLVSVFMMIIISIFLKMYPFGERTILISDINKQFNDYFAYFKTVITEGNHFIYTFSKNLGGDMIGFSAYYLQNPFLFLLLLFPNKILPLGIWFIIILQIACCSASFCYYLNKESNTSSFSIIFSLAYGFMGYIFAYITLPIYLNNIILLPLVILGIHKIIKNYQDRGLYIITLSLSVFFNYYLGFMLCIFSMLFFIYLLVLEIETFDKVKVYSKVIVSYISSSVFSILLMAFDLIPVVFSLQGQKTVPTGSTFSFYRNFKMLDVFSRLYSNAFDGNTSNDNLPFIYVSIFAIICVIIYFFCNNISKKEKIISLLFICVMLISFYIHSFDVIWHGFNDPVGFPYRYAFYFSFLLLFIANRGFSVINYNIQFKTVVPFGCIFIIYSGYLLFSNRNALIFKSIAFDMVLFISITVLFTIANHKGWSGRKVFFCILALQIINLSVNAIVSIRQYDDYVPMSEYSNYISQAEPLITYVKERDTSLYRMEKNFERSHNDAMQFNYRGLSHSSSCEKDYVKIFMGKMGFRNFGLWAYYNEGSTTFADSFLGIKYYISRFDATGKPYERIYQENEKSIFENAYSLPLAFGVTQKVLSVDMMEKDLFALQNEMASINGKENFKIYNKVKVEDISLINLKLTEEKGTKKYEKIALEEDAYIEYTLNITDENLIYIFFDALKEQAAEITINDFPYGNYFTDTKWDIIEIGSYKKGESVSVKVYVKGENISINESYFYYEDEEEIKKWYNKASVDSVNLNCLSDSHLQGEVIVKKSNYIMFSIPYEKGWNIFVDDKKVSQIQVMDALMAVPVSSGRHTIELIYVPQGLYIGLVITLLSFISGIFIKKNVRTRHKN